MKKEILFLVLGWIITGFSSGQIIDFKDAVKEIQRTSSRFPMPGEEDHVEKPKIVEILRHYAELSPKGARKLVGDLMAAETDSLDTITWEKVYIFNRLYCNVPENVDQKTWEFFGGWSIPNKNGVLKALYPLSLSKEGNLELRGGLWGAYMGGPYEGVKEFDFLFKRYGKRQKVVKYRVLGDLYMSSTELGVGTLIFTLAGLGALILMRYKKTGSPSC